MKVNLGCGRDLRDGWINVDMSPLPGVDVVVDFEAEPLPFPDDSVEEVYCSHVLEHIRQPLPLMQELWRVAKPDAVARFRTPYGSSDDADEDPTHVRRLFINSWMYFGQGAYCRADYGYRGDWQTERVELHIDPMFTDASDDEVMVGVRMSRNVVREMVAQLRAVKPAREPVPASQAPFDVVIVRE